MKLKGTAFLTIERRILIHIYYLLFYKLVQNVDYVSSLLSFQANYANLFRLKN